MLTLASLDGRALFAWGALWLVLIAYALLTSIDFGAGCYAWLASLRPQSKDAQAAGRVALAYLAPVWEVTNVFLILFVVGMIGFFPISARIFGTALLVPVSLASIALVARGALFAFHHLDHSSMSRRMERWVLGGFALSGFAALTLLVPFLAASESGAITLGASGAVIVSQMLLWLSPLQLTLAALAIAAALYLGALTLAGYAARRDEPAAARFFRVAAWRMGWAMGALAIALAVALAVVAPFHFAALVALWPLHLALLALFALTQWALLRDESRSVRITTWGGPTLFAVALGAFGLTRLPWLLYPSVQIGAALTPPATFTALTITLGVGTLLLLPSLGLFYALILRPAPAKGATANKPTSAKAAPARHAA